MKAVILAAGKGIRLAPLTDTVPKVLVEIKPGTTLLGNTLDKLPEKIDEIILITHYLSDQVKEYVENHAPEGLKCRFVEQETLDGTFSAVCCAKPFLEENESFLVLNGDDLYCENELKELCSHDCSGGMSNSGPSDYRNISVSKDGLYTFHPDRERPNNRGAIKNDPEDDTKYYVATGAYVLPFKVLDAEPVKTNSGEYGLPHTVANIDGLEIEPVFFAKWMQVNDSKQLEEVRESFK